MGRILALRRLKPEVVEEAVEVVMVIATSFSDTLSLESEADTARCNKIVADDSGRQLAFAAQFADDSAGVAVAVAETFQSSIYHAQHRSRCEIPVASPRRFRRCIDDDERTFRSTSHVALTIYIL